jgi:aryl-alcohol dehydrogenase-like predicted oxidoreductase
MQGDTDRAISKWLPTRKREEIVLATKVSGRGDVDLHNASLKGVCRFWE